MYRRMEAEHLDVANELRSTGAAEGEKSAPAADRQREITIANAYRDAQKVKGGVMPRRRAFTQKHLVVTRNSRSSPEPGCLQSQLQ